MARDQREFTVRPFDVASSADPEVAALVTQVIDAGLAKHRLAYDKPARVADLTGGPELLRKDPAWNRRGIMAVLEQARHWKCESDRLAEQIEQVERDGDQPSLHQRTEDDKAYLRYNAGAGLLEALLRRRLPLSDDDLTTLIRATVDGVLGSHIQPSSVIKQVEYASGDRKLDSQVLDALVSLRDNLDSFYYGKTGKLQRRIDHLLAEVASDSGSAEIPPPPGKVLPPSWAGQANVLVHLKKVLGLTATVGTHATATETIGPDRVLLPVDSPLEKEHALISTFLRDTMSRRIYWGEVASDNLPNVFRAMTPQERGRLYIAAWERRVEAHDTSNAIGNDPHPTSYAYMPAGALPTALAEMALEFDREGLFDALLPPTAVPSTAEFFTTAVEAALDQIEQKINPVKLTPGEQYVLNRVRCASIEIPPMGMCPPLAKRVCKLLDEPSGYWLVPGEYWSDALHADLADMTGQERQAWQAALTLAATATSAKPSSKWDKAATDAVRAIGAGKLRERGTAWFAAVPKGRSFKTLEESATINDGNATILRGLVWMLARHSAPQSPRQVAELLLTCIKKIPGVGPRAVKVANACVWALGEMAAGDDPALRDAALGQLARFKARVTFKTTLNAIERALDKAAAQAGMSRDDLEELGVPAFSFENGVRREILGDAAVELRVERNKVVTRWTNAKGKAVKAPPAAVTRDFKDDVKELKQAAKDAEGILLAGRDRLDSLFLAGKAWPLADWRERYLDHGLLGTLARRLIWLVGDTPVLFDGDTPTDVDGRAVDVDASAQVRLWHPVGRHPQEVQAWRRRVEDQQITQPFKQAHREVYLLTDAERNTNVYSNRFAAHVLKQHQFNALCAARGWKNTLRLMVDDEYPPASRELPHWGLRAEFWVEGAGDEYGADTNESGVYLYLATDQVRFYPTEAAQLTAHAGGGGYGFGRWRGQAEPDPVPLDQIPPLVLSEILRDVDLFVGVASVGNDPNWADGGPQGRYRDYWTSYSFGDLSATAQTRKVILEHLVPRLKIAPRCSFNEKYLVVRGDVRTYKIHLGSGNILMEPNDQYLCIVPKSSAMESATGKVFLPFEGDRTMALVLSKAFLLAEDTKISDPTILSQIGRG